MNLKILLNCSLLSLIMSTPVLANYSGKVLAKKIPPEVKYALAEIKTKTLVPIILPTVLPRYDIPLIAGGEVDKKYTKDAYYIFYGTSEKCTSSNCSFGSTGGELISDMTKDPTKEYNQLISDYVTSGRLPKAPKRLEGGYITLSRGIRGFYIPSLCVYCGSAKIIWQQDEYQYFVAIPKVGTLKQLIKIANSAIDNRP
jgi:hypothetical protein